MDWPRYVRAVAAGNAEQLERRRQDYLAGRLKASDLTDEWEDIKEHDRLFGAYYGSE